MHRRQLILSGLAATAGASGLSACATGPAADPNYPIRSDQQAQAYSAEELIAAGSRELGIAAEALGSAIERIFADQGDRPTAYIAGEEGSGAAGVAVTKLLMGMGLKNVILCDSKGAIYKGREGMNPFKQQMAGISNIEMKKGTLKDVIAGADIFIGVSAPGIVTEEMIASMSKDPIIFAMSNPTPEIMPDLAKAAGAAVIGTGRSDFPNQINNVLAFPGIFRGALDVRASDINDSMKIAAAYAIAGFVPDDRLSPEYILPAPFEPGIGAAVAQAVAQAARESGVARI